MLTTSAQAPLPKGVEIIGEILKFVETDEMVRFLEIVEGVEILKIVETVEFFGIIKKDGVFFSPKKWGNRKKKNCEINS